MHRDVRHGSTREGRGARAWKHTDQAVAGLRGGMGTCGVGWGYRRNWRRRRPQHVSFPSLLREPWCVPWTCKAARIKRVPTRSGRRQTRWEWGGQLAKGLALSALNRATWANTLPPQQTFCHASSSCSSSPKLSSVFSFFAADGRTVVTCRLASSCRLSSLRLNLCLPSAACFSSRADAFCSDTYSRESRQEGSWIWPDAC